MKKLYLITLLGLLTTGLFAQNKNPWQEVSELSFAKADMERRIIPNKYKTFSLDRDALQSILKEAPMRFSEAAKAKTAVLSIPMPDGKFQDFELVEAPVMHPDLGAKYPDIKTYAGWSKTDGTAYLRCGISPSGFHGMILSGRHSSVYIDIYAVGETDHYVCYYKKDFHRNDKFICHFDEIEENQKLQNELKGKRPAEKVTGDCQFRVYSLALACTGEYAQYHGGTKPQVLAAMNTAMARVNGIYERDVDVTMVIIPNNDDLIFLNAATDPYTNGSGGAMLNQNINTCNSIIGNANYNIGHVFSTGGGGVAFLRSACNNGNKAGGVTGLPNPVGDPFYVDYAAHEMGHQFGGNHTQNNSCNRNTPTAMEPGSASTIMGYAGICNPNVQNNSDDYFHAVSLAEMGNHIAGNGGACASLSPNGNSAPTVSTSGVVYDVPVETPFVLTGEGSDPDMGNALTYCWEQMDNQPATMPPSPNNTSGPAFRSLLPTPEPSRYFPNLNTILANGTDTWEVLPSVSRQMNFRCTVRDNNPGGGCTGETDVQLNFSDAAGPFLVTEPNDASVVWSSNFLETVTWDVANTDQAPVNASSVDIFLSIDGGITYPYLLLSGTPNDGSQLVQVPDVTSNAARVMVKGTGNVFLDISDEPFTIEMNSTPTFTINASPVVQTACPQGEVEYVFDLQSFVGFNEAVSFIASGVPPGATFGFQPNPIVPPGDVTFVVSDLENVTPGSYTIIVEAVAVSVDQSITLELIVLDEITSAPGLISPVDGATGVTTAGAVLEWENMAAATNYIIEVALDPSFQTLTFTDDVYQNHFDLPTLQPGTVYYWRVKGVNTCSDGFYAPFYAFQTGGLECDTYESTDVGQNIPPNGGGEIESELMVDDDLPIASVYLHLDISHTWVGDLLAILEGPDGTSALLFDRPGDPATADGCQEDDMSVGFFDQAANTSDDLENTCDPISPAIEGDFQPLTALSAFDGKSTMGTWKLIVDDLFPSVDDGTLDAWYLELCGTVVFPPAILLNNTKLTVNQGASENITDAFLETQGIPGQTTYILLSVPENGTLFLQNSELEIGSSFTQEDLNNGLVSYQHDGSMTAADEFLFDVVDDETQWLHNQLFEIEILEPSIIAAANVTQELDCFNASNAAISVDVTGGTPPLTYSLNGGTPQSENTFDGLAAGTYEVMVMDADGLSVTSNAVVVENPAAIIVSATVTEDTITVDANGGTGTLQYSVDGTNFQNSNVFEDLANGSYTVYVMDENGCVETTIAIVAVNTLIVTALQTQGVSCNNGSDGIITINVGGGTPPYQYSLNGGPFQNGNVFSGLPAGTYEGTVEDDEGFTLNTNVVVLENPSAVMASASVVENDVTVDASGGTGNLQYSIDGANFQNSNIFADLPNGTYDITVMDENGCTETTTATVFINTLVVTATQTQDVLCAGGSDGEITVEVAGGNPDFQYSLDGVNYQNSNVFQNLPAGTYTITVLDTDDFTQTDMVVISEPPAIAGDASANGYEVTVNATGGTGTLQYSLDGGPFQNGNQFFPVASGDHVVVVTDENGCEVSIPISVNVPALAVDATTIQMAVCADSEDGAITVEGTGGVPPYEYSLNGGPFQSSNDFTGLAAGDYTVTVMDSGGFTVSSTTLTVLSPPALLVDATTNNDEIMVNVTGGADPYLFQLDSSLFQASNIFTGVSNGPHIVTVQDVNGCEMSVTVLVNVPALELIASVNQQVSCHGEMDGEIMINATGGIPPYEYSIDGMNFQNDATFPGLTAGIYQPTVRDATGQILNAPNVTIIEPDPVTATGNAFGPTITIDAMGGTGDFSYSFDNGPFQPENEFNAADNGTYNVIVMDENGCTDSLEVVVNMPENISLATINVICPGADTGSIQINDVVGGYAPYMYSLNGGPFTSETLYTGLAAGEYNLVVMDSTGYEWMAPVIIINESPDVLVGTTVVDNNLTINASGGTGGLMYSIDGGTNFQSDSTFTDLPNGTYEVVVMDGNGCTATTTVMINFTSTNEVNNGLLFEVTPNPSTGRFYLTLQTRTVGEINMTVYNAVGQVVHVFATPVNGQLQQELDLSFLANGNYQLRVTSGELWGVKRLMIVE
ncbi:MAG: reprolysin-like metallopeptidase [Bacteroidota bacterium]